MAETHRECRITLTTMPLPYFRHSQRPKAPATRVWLDEAKPSSHPRGSRTRFFLPARPCPCVFSWPRRLKSGRGCVFSRCSILPYASQPKAFRRRLKTAGDFLCKEQNRLPDRGLEFCTWEFSTEQKENPRKAGLKAFSGELSIQCVSCVYAHLGSPVFLRKVLVHFCQPVSCSRPLSLLGKELI